MIGISMNSRAAVELFAAQPTVSVKGEVGVSGIN